ncbi:MAG: PASTA domain-containing protein [Planctomycetaceae bacterium]
MRRFTPDRFVALVLCGITAASSPAIAQEAGRARVTATEAAAEQPTGQEPRPTGQALHRPPDDPQLDRVLNDWFQKTRGINKLQGDHRRYTYEATFQVVKVSEGKFYFEAPDKGRIDLEPVDEKSLKDSDPNAEGVQIPEAGQQKLFTLKPDQPEQWVCDGTQIMRVDNAAKTYEVSTIPKEHRGKNIMDGPLPFLFGLPPEKAKQRYAMTLQPLPPERGVVYLVVTPLLKQDAANWQRADVMLDARTYLPTAIKLLDPSGNRVTVFSFGDHQANKVNLISWIGIGDPFKPALIGYKQVQSGAPQPVRVAENGKVEALTGMPAVVGLSHSDAQKTLTTRGFAKEQIKFAMDTAPSNEKLKWHVKSQQPAPKAAVQPGQTIVLTLYVTQQDLDKERARKAQAAN